MASAKRRKTAKGNGYNRWTETEEKALYELSNQGFTDPEISKQMNRSVSSITNRRFVLRERGLWEDMEVSQYRGYQEQEKEKE
ncbi:hypothetical protein [Lactococcus lactis]|uniref:hypothetical protein n=1 Tax=Lactococcus lactis TaxID=1358 RepID=UPI0024A74126|nr:hypothetical protein [Lactococcus lactis]